MGCIGQITSFLCVIDASHPLVGLDSRNTLSSSVHPVSWGPTYITSGKLCSYHFKKEESEIFSLLKGFESKFCLMPKEVNRF